MAFQDYSSSNGTILSSSCRHFLSKIRERFESYNYIISPVIPTVAFAAAALGADDDQPIAHIAYTGLNNQTGQPASSICCGFAENGLPIGMQIIGKRYDGLGVLQLSHFYEQHRRFTIPRPMD